MHDEFNRLLVQLTRLLTWRTRVWRMLVGGMLIDIAVMLVWLFTGAWRESAALAMALPLLVVMFIAVDAGLVSNWARKTRALLRQPGSMSVETFKAAVRSLPWLPPSTVTALLERLSDEASGASRWRV